MAKKNKTPQVTKPLKYFAYFNPENLMIIGVSNGTEPDHQYFVELPVEDYLLIGQGKKYLHEYKINKIVNFDGTITIDHQLMTQQIYDDYNLKSKSFVWINTAVDNNTEFVVDWNNTDKNWTFSITDCGRNILSGSQYDSTVVIFLTLETDFDFLIRTFYLRIHDLLKFGKIVYNFESNIESKIDNISIVTKKMFNVYGLQIND
jgi:hypothetical protein